MTCIWLLQKLLEKAVQISCNRRFGGIWKSSAPKEVVDDYIASYSMRKKKQK
jgi:hypothetical protein